METGLELRRKNSLRFRRVERLSGVSDVLSAVEHAECKSGQEVTRRQVTGNRSYDKPSLLCTVHTNAKDKNSQAEAIQNQGRTCL